MYRMELDIVDGIYESLIFHIRGLVFPMAFKREIVPSMKCQTSQRSMHRDNDLKHTMICYLPRIEWRLGLRCCQLRNHPQMGNKKQRAFAISAAKFDPADPVKSSQR